MEAETDGSVGEAVDKVEGFEQKTPLKKQRSHVRSECNFKGRASSNLGDLYEDGLKHIQFDSWEEAGAWYREYARENGFGIRKRDFRRLNDGTLVCYKWLFKARDTGSKMEGQGE